MEQELAERQAAHADFSEKKNKEIKDLQAEDRKTNEYVKRVEEAGNKFKAHCEKYKRGQVAKLFHLDEVAATVDLKNDNTDRAPDDVLQFPEDDKGLTDARLVTFQQLYDFNNLFLNRSYLRKRTTTNEKKIAAIIKELEELQAWRLEHEENQAKQFEAVDAHFVQNEEKFDKFEIETNEKFVEDDKRMSEHAAFLGRLDKALDVANGEIAEMQRVNDLQQTSLDNYHDREKKELDKRLQAITDLEQSHNRTSSQAIELLGRELEKLKYDVADVVDNRFESIMLKMDQETKNLKATFEKLSNALEVASKDLNESFEGKQLTLKTMCATYFAKMDLFGEDLGRKVKELHKHFYEIEGSFVNPAKVVDAKLFAINQKIMDNEQMREQ